MEHGIIQERIREAESLYRSHGQRILALPEMNRRLTRYDRAIENTQASMRQTGIAAACSLCSERTGSCCFQEVETWYDPMLLLINLLLGSPLPHAGILSGECIFLGKQGCRLRARYAFCLNYLCPSLRTQLGPAGAKAVLAAVGEELAAGWEMEQALYGWLSKET